MKFLPHILIFIGLAGVVLAATTLAKKIETTPTTIQASELSKSSRPSQRWLAIEGCQVAYPLGVSIEKRKRRGGSSVTHWYPLLKSDGMSTGLLVVVDEEDVVKLRAATTIEGLVHESPLPDDVATAMQDAGFSTTGHWKITFGQKPMQQDSAILIGLGGLALTIAGAFIIVRRRKLAKQPVGSAA